jgi:nucleotide-binding universal stress UspA family protein
MGRSVSAGPVVAGVDGSQPSLQALKVALVEARLRHRPLRVIHVGRRAAGLEISALKEVTAIAGGSVGVDITVQTLSGRPARVLARVAGPEGLVVVGARGRGAVGSILLGSTSRRLVGDAPCPVVVVRCDLPEVDRAAQRVLVGIDAATPAPVVGFAFDEASRRGAELRAVHAWERHRAPGSALTRVPAEARQERMAAEDEVLTEALLPWQGKYPEVTVERVVTSGDAGTALTAQSALADLLVVGCGARRTAKAPDLGSTAYAVLHGARCPVAMVPMH